MSNVLGTLFQDIANAIREKSGDTATMKPAEFPDKISAIEAGGGSADDRVKYVTFMDGTNSEIIPSQQMTFSNGGSDGIGIASIAFADIGITKITALNDSEKCFVTLDGAIHELNRTVTDTGSYWGNMALGYAGADTGESVLLFYVTDASVLTLCVKETTTDTTVTHTIGIYTETMQLIKYPVIEGDTVRDPVANGYIEAPTKEQTVSTVYTYNGWSLTNGGSADSTALQNVTEDRVVYAAFMESLRKYIVNFYDGDTLVHSEAVAYGGSSSYIFTKDGFTFDGWSPEAKNITSDTDCYAQWKTAPTFAGSSWSDIMTVIDEGKAEEYFKVGNTRTITLEDGTTKTLYILGFNHDTLADGSGTATMTLGCPPISSVTMPVSDWSTVSSTMSSQIKPLLPSEIQSAIKPVIKECDTNVAGEIVNITFDLFPLSFEECKVKKIGSIDFGTTDWAARVTDLGETYDYFALTSVHDSTYGGPVKYAGLYSYYVSTPSWWRQTSLLYKQGFLTCHNANYSGGYRGTYGKSTAKTESHPVMLAFCI